MPLSSFLASVDDRGTHTNKRSEGNNRQTKRTDNGLLLTTDDKSYLWIVFKYSLEMMKTSLVHNLLAVFIPDSQTLDGREAIFQGFQV